MTNTYRLGFIFLALAIVFGLEAFSGFFVLHKFWPLIITNLGVGLLAVFFKRNTREGIFLGVGIYLVCISILMLICNFFSWSLLENLWPLFIGFIGISFLGGYIFSNRSKMNLIGAIFFIAIGTVFIMVFTVSPKFWWLIFVFLSAAVFVSGGKNEK